MNNKIWAFVVILSIAFYFIFLVLLTGFGSNIAQEFGLSTGQTLSNVNLSEQLQPQFSCDYPRYRFNRDGEPTRYVFNLDDLRCENSVGAVSELSCNDIQGCLWDNVTSGWLFFQSVTERCTGEINKTFYNNGVPTTKNICMIDGLQGQPVLCARLGCTAYEPSPQLFDRGVGFMGVVQQTSDLFTFRYDFGFENGLASTFATFLLVWLPLVMLLGAIYILSPFSL